MISVIIPVYNEQEVLNVLYERLKKVMDSTNEEYEFIFINDGSTDKSYEILKNLHMKDPACKIVNFSRNFGHQVAITAGIDFCKGDAVVIIDADLQDPPELIPQMIKKWKDGAQIVHARREKREGESLFKKTTAKFFYRILHSLTSVSIPVDVGDFRLIDRKVIDVLRKIKERNRFVRGLVSWTGFVQDEVTYIREPRYAGSTKYPFKKMVRFALNGITSFSDKPLKIASVSGFLFSFLAFLYSIYVLYLKFFTQKTIQGWTTLVIFTLFFNGYTLIMLGILGEYIGRIYEEVKERPLYIIDEIIGIESKP